MTASPESLQERYQAIERIYSERQWDDVARLSEALLLDLPDSDDHPLRQRLQLLLGHTYLYGYRDATTATGFYNRVRAATSERVLREIADQGLAQCASQVTEQTPTPTSSPSGGESLQPSAGQAFPFSAQPIPDGARATGAMPAMPWMEQLDDKTAAMAVAQTAVHSEEPALGRTTGSEMALVVDVIEEPELIELAQADADSAEVLEVIITAETTDAGMGTFSPEEIADLSKGLLRVVIR